MKELIRLFEKDIMSEHFTRREYVIYGVVYPLALIAVAIVAGAIE